MCKETQPNISVGDSSSPLGNPGKGNVFDMQPGEGFSAAHCARKPGACVRLQGGPREKHKYSTEAAFPNQIH